jgi:hypothetical protein
MLFSKSFLSIIPENGRGDTKRGKTLEQKFGRRATQLFYSKQSTSDADESVARDALSPAPSRAFTIGTLLAKKKKGAIKF